MVNFNNILTIIFFQQKIAKPNLKKRKVLKNTFIQISCSKNVCEIDTWCKAKSLKPPKKE